MLVVTPLTPAAAPYYFQGQAAGRWVGAGIGGLGVGGEVDRAALVALLEGRHPSDGHFLPARKPARRRAGWDLTLAAPKSVSLLAAMATTDGPEIATAHQAAVDEVVGHFERRLLGLRRAASPGGVAASDGLVAGAFDHRVNASGEPHLHTHLIVCNLGRDGEGVWSAIDSSWWTARHSLGAVYQLGLRHHLSARGLELEWRVRDDGLADVIGVPRAAVRSASGRSRAASADRIAFGVGDAGRRSGIRAGATAQTRRSAPAQPWQARAATAGFGPEQAARVVHDARPGREPREPREPGLAHAELAGAVSARLALQRSWFREADALVALAGCAPAGCSGPEAERWVEQFCAAAIPVPGRSGQAPRWTTPAARAADQRLIDRAQHPVGTYSPPLDRTGVAAALVGYAGLSSEGTAAVRELLSSHRPVEILLAPPGRTNLLTHAAVLEAAAAGWRAGGQRAAVATSSEHSAARWRVLTGIERHEGGRPADVVVVDHADRRPTPELLGLLADIDRAGARAVLIEGGTCPRLTWRCSDGLTRLGDQLGRIDPGPAPAWADTLGTARRPDGTRQEVARCSTAVEAVHHLLAGWAAAWAAGWVGAWATAGNAADPAVLVGLGYAETDGLNQAARAVLVRRGEISGPILAGGPGPVQAGDRILALRRLAPDLPGGTALTVVKVDAQRSAATVKRSEGGPAVTLDRNAVAHLGYGYAVTPALAARSAGDLMVLGPPEALGRQRARVVGAALVAPERGAGLKRDRGAGIDIGIG